MKKYSIKEMAQKNYYAGGYPAFNEENEENFLFQTNESNFFIDSGIYKLHSRLDYWQPKDSKDDESNLFNKFGEKIIGHIDVNFIDRKYYNTTTHWNDHDLYNWGYNYLINGVFHLKAGASGSLVSDEEGNVLGLYRMNDKVQNKGFVEPLRSDGIYNGNKIIVPPYDLIRGSKGQKGSYKEQLEEHYPSLNTFLKSQSWK